MEGTVTISKVEYLRLRICEEIEDRLGAAGAYDWSSYIEALNPDNEPSMKEWEEDEKKRIEAL